MNKYPELCIQGSDINEHLPVLSELSEECSHITEMGVRNCVSTWAFVNGLKKGGRLVSIDINNPPEKNLNEVKEYCKEKGIEFDFWLGDTRDIEIEDTDLLFIDTNHFREQLTIELQRHGYRASKYIVLHDTESCKEELWPAISSFVGDDFFIKDIYRNNNGLTVLERK